MPASDYFNFWPFGQQQGNYQQALESQVQSGVAGGGAGQAQFIENTQMQMQQVSQEQINHYNLQQQALSQTTRWGYIQNISGFNELFTNIGAMSCNVGANITKIIVDRETYVRILRDLGSINRSIDSDCLIINTVIGPIKIGWCETEFTGINLDKYLEDVG